MWIALGELLRSISLRCRIMGRRGREIPTTIFVALLLLGISRSPYIFFRGRFWAEEGSVFFRHMATLPFPESLFFVYERGGYYYLFANAANLVAAQFPLAWSPLVTAWLSFGVVMSLVGLIIFGPSVFAPRVRYIAAALILLGTPSHPEVWANSINAQVYLGLMAFFVLFLDSVRLSAGWRLATLLLLVVAGLSGLYAAVIAPVFALKWLRTRSTFDGLAAGVLSAAAGVQIAVIFHARATGSLVETKLTVGSVGDVFLSTGALHFSSLFFGRDGAGDLLRRAEAGEWRGILMVTAAWALIGLCLWLIFRRGDRSVLQYVVIGWFLTEFLVHLGSHGQPGGRYSVAPLGIIAIGIAYGWNGGGRLRLDKGSIASVLATGAILASGIFGFWLENEKFLSCDGCPDWRSEIDRWREDPSTDIHIWPYPRWTMRLPEVESLR